MTTSVINERSVKADIIDASCEVIDTQAEQLQELKLQRRFLIVTVAALITLLQF